MGVQAQTSGLTLTEFSCIWRVILSHCNRALEFFLPVFSIILTTLFIKVRHIPMDGALVSIFVHLPSRKVYLSLFVICDSSRAVTLQQQRFNRLNSNGHVA